METMNLNQIINQLNRIQQNMVTKEELNQFMETFAIMSNEDSMCQILESEKDIQEGRVKEVNSVEDL